jgi:hypothetical protein
MSKALVLLGLLGAGGLSWLFWPSNANASPLQANAATSKRRPPKSVQEAYAWATDPSEKDAEYVHELAVWLLNNNANAEAAKAEARAVSLRAERVLTHGLSKSASKADVAADIKTLTGFDSYQQVLMGRLEVEQGRVPPAPFVLQLNSGGSLTIDLGLYSATPASGPSGSPTVVVPATSSGGASAPGSLAEEETKPENDPHGTIALARLLLGEQGAAGWKRVSEDVRQWQSRIGLTADGKFGPEAAVTMGREVGQLPWVRYFSLGVGDGSKAASVDAYRANLRALASSLAKARPEHAAALLLSATREKGQGWPSKPSASPATPFTAAQIEQALAAARGGE